MVSGFFVTPIHWKWCLLRVVREEISAVEKLSQMVGEWLSQVISEVPSKIQR